MDWRLLPDCPLYEVSEFGHVRRVGGNPLKPSLSDSGYLRVQLSAYGRRRKKLVHVAVLEAFRGPRPSPVHHGAHGNGDKYNNHVSNLAWKLPKENEADKKVHGTAPTGQPQRKLKTSDIRKIFRLLSGGASYSKVARDMKLHRSFVARVHKGKRWRKVQRTILRAS